MKAHLQDIADVRALIQLYIDGSGGDAAKLKDDIAQLVLEDYFMAHPDAARRRHHALLDAGALCATWRALTGRDKAAWSPALAARL